MNIYGEPNWRDGLFALEGGRANSAVVARVSRFAALTLLFMTLAGCQLPHRCSCERAARTEIVATPIMQDVLEWMRERQFECIQHEAEGGLVLSAAFADVPGELPACTCIFVTNPPADTLTVTAIFSPEITSGLELAAVGWLVAANADSSWGFFGFDVQDRQLWFRLSLFRPERRVKAEEMDRMLDETMTALQSVRGILMQQPEQETEPTGPETPERPTSLMFAGSRTAESSIEFVHVMSEQSALSLIERAGHRPASSFRRVGLYPNCRPGR